VSNEGSLSRNIMEELRKQVGGWWVKYHSSAYTPKGVPDILGGCQGLFFALETKKKGNEPTTIQQWNIDEINRQGGHAIVVRSPKEALEFVKSCLE
jgi:Holliday junction resolvase